ncbi:hypothetical protein [Algibacter sp. 2305UL17-15]|uniref:hypothetical protein n=1 Tax=Algibacter sp. 2305UL17-15 TaxID=3231268 RepID=UPI0034582B8D
MKDSNSTNSGAKSLFLPSPYAIRMAILNQAITLDGVDFETGKGKNEYFTMVRDADISYFLTGNYCVNNCFVKILKPSRSRPGEVQETVSFREYIHINEPIEIIFSVKNEKQKAFLKTYMHKINYFGKRGCFFQFIEYKEHPTEPNVKLFSGDSLSAGVLQEYDDFNKKLTFEHVNSYGGKSSVNREKQLFILPLARKKSSKGYTGYNTI